MSPMETTPAVARLDPLDAFWPPCPGLTMITASRGWVPSGRVTVSRVRACAREEGVGVRDEAGASTRSS
jgi:hypothetical protein